MPGLPDDFLLRAALAGIGVALAAGPLGCFVVWRRMAYFGDATAHAAILGVALSLWLSWATLPGVLIAALAMAGWVSAISGRTRSLDTALGVAAHAALAAGAVGIALVGPAGVDLEAYLFGEILAVGPGDLAVVWGGAALVLGLVLWRWQSLLLATFGPDLAAADGVSPAREKAVLTVALAVVVAVALKVVGALLITAMLIIPAATARPFARTPEAMALAATALGAAAVIGGLGLAWHWDTPAGPTIVTAAAAGFVGAQLLAGLAGLAVRLLRR